MKTIAILSVLLLCGCRSPSKDMAKLVDALAKDPATASINVVSTFGTIKIVRTNPGTNTETTVTPDGTVTVKRIN